MVCSIGISIIGCTDKEVHRFRFNDWPNYYTGSTSNPFYDDVFTVTNDLAEVRIHVTKVIEGEKKEGLISARKFKNGILQEHYESPFTADISTTRYYYDEYGNVIKQECYDYENIIIPSQSFEYTYEYDAEKKEFTQKVYSEGKLQRIFRETPIKKGYRLEKESLERKIIENIYEVDISKHKVVQFRKTYDSDINTYYYDFTYKNKQLNTILYRNATSWKEIYIIGYEVVKYDEHGNIAEMIVYDYDRKDKTKREPMYKVYFFDYDKAGNWRRQEWIREKYKSEPEITIREFIYTE